jgi:hypothetical protein
MRRWMLESNELDVRPSMRILTYTGGIAWRSLMVKQLSSALKHDFTTENAENIEQGFSWKLLRGLCDLCGESSSLRSVAREAVEASGTATRRRIREVRFGCTEFHDDRLRDGSALGPSPSE